jgi:hypothetical protein
VERTLASGEVVLFLRIGAPHFAGSANGEFVKKFVDGVLVALHYEPDPRQVVDVARRIASRVGLPEKEVARLLCDDSKAALGPVADSCACAAMASNAGPTTVAWRRFAWKSTALRQLGQSRAAWLRGDPNPPDTSRTAPGAQIA